MPMNSEFNELLQILRNRFEQNTARHNGLDWKDVETKLLADSRKLFTLSEMERTGGEPDVVSIGGSSGEYVFVDCSPESPKGRRNVCYDQDALDSRKEHKPNSSALEMAKQIGIELLTEQQYAELQSVGAFDQKTSSWIATPADVRSLGGALFGDRRFGRVFTYHNGAGSYYSARGFRGSLRV